MNDLRSSNQTLLTELNSISQEAKDIRTDVSDKFKRLEQFNDLAKDTDLSTQLKKLIELVSTEENEQIR